MSKLDDNQSWSNVGERNLDSKYEKCRNITEEIYKRINITFEIKKLETQSDLSDKSEIDSNELSNETDLFACDKTSITSSTDADKPQLSFEKFINNNNNEESKKATLYKRPKKRFRKRQKKRLNKTVSESDVSSDEAVPLCRTIDLGAKRDDVSCSNGSLDSVMGVPKLVIGGKDLKSKSPTKETKPGKIADTIQTPLTDDVKSVPSIAIIKIDMRNASSPKIIGKDAKEKKNCNICNLTFRGDRGLRRHMTMSHIIVNEKNDTTKHGVRSA